jgi:glucosamine-phosphate N-acetyltransferase
MIHFEYNTLWQLIQENPTHTDEIVEQYIVLLSSLTDTPVISKELFLRNLHEIQSMGLVYVCYCKTIENQLLIVGSGTIIFEPKIIRNGKYVGHIEDIVVSEKCRSMGIAKKIINDMISLAKEKGCYKVILDCNTRLSGFYEKLGFKKHGIQMSTYF